MGKVGQSGCVVLISRVRGRCRHIIPAPRRPAHASIIYQWCYPGPYDVSNRRSNLDRIARKGVRNKPTKPLTHFSEKCVYQWRIWIEHLGIAVNINLIHFLPIFLWYAILQHKFFLIYNHTNLVLLMYSNYATVNFDFKYLRLLKS